MDMQFFDQGDYLTLKAAGYNPDDVVGSNGWSGDVGLNSKGEVIYFDLTANPGKWLPVLDGSIEKIEESPPPGTYSITSLGLRDLSFLDLVKALRGLYAPVAAAS